MNHCCIMTSQVPVVTKIVSNKYLEFEQRTKNIRIFVVNVSINNKLDLAATHVDGIRESGGNRA